MSTVKVIESTSTLLKHLSYVSSAIPSNPVVPILENVLFELNDGLLKITSSDLKNTISTFLYVEHEGNGSVAIPAKMLIDTLKNLPEQPVSICIDSDTLVIEIKSDSGKYKMSGENANDYPKSPEYDSIMDVELTSSLLSDSIAHTLFCVSNDDMKPAMTGVCFDMDNNGINFVSTDSNRLTRYSRTDVYIEGSERLILPKKALMALKACLPSNDIPVTLSFNESNASFSWESFTLTCQLIDEKFPEYSNVIPTNNDKEIILSRHELIGSLKRLVIYSNKSTNQVRLRISNDEISIFAEDMDFSVFANEKVYCEYGGDSIEIGFNAKFLVENLTNLNSDKVVLRLRESNVAGLISPLDMIDDEDVLMLVMPILLKSYE